jgi:hypothetical protein
LHFTNIEDISARANGYTAITSVNSPSGPTAGDRFCHGDDLEATLVAEHDGSAVDTRGLASKTAQRRWPFPETSGGPEVRSRRPPTCLTIETAGHARPSPDLSRAVPYRTTSCPTLCRVDGHAEGVFDGRPWQSCHAQAGLSHITVVRESRAQQGKTACESPELPPSPGLSARCPGASGRNRGAVGLIDDFE